VAEARSLEAYPIHLGLGARAIPQPEFTGFAWYEIVRGDFTAMNSPPIL
jgi:hypothetical protein